MYPEYVNVVTKAWMSTLRTICRKLNMVQTDYIKFNHKVFGNIFRRKHLLEGHIRGIHKLLDTFPFSSLITLEKVFQI